MKSKANAVLILMMLVAIAAGPVTAYGQPGTLAYIGIYSDEAGSTCQITPSGNNYSIAYVVLTNSIPLKQIRFRAPVPECLGGSATVAFESSQFAVTGDSQTGIIVDLGGCTTAPVTLLTIYYVESVPADCCSWQVRPFEGLTVDFVDCDDVVRPGASAVNGPSFTGECCVEFDVLAPYEPYPPDGATGVSTEVDLHWLLPDLRCGEWIYFDDVPAPWQIVPTDNFDYFTTYEPGTLEPNTTYYWKVYMACSEYAEYAPSTSPLWSFTTGGGPVAVEATTWGRVKALYSR